MRCVAVAWKEHVHPRSKDGKFAPKPKSGEGEDEGTAGHKRGTQKNQKDDWENKYGFSPAYRELLAREGGKQKKDVERNRKVMLGIGLGVALGVGVGAGAAAYGAGFDLTSPESIARMFDADEWANGLLNAPSKFGSRKATLKIASHEAWDASSDRVDDLFGHVEDFDTWQMSKQADMSMILLRKAEPDLYKRSLTDISVLKDWDPASIPVADGLKAEQTRRMMVQPSKFREYMKTIGEVDEDVLDSLSQGEMMALTSRSHAYDRIAQRMAPELTAKGLTTGWVKGRSMGTATEWPVMGEIIEGSFFGTVFRNGSIQNFQHAVKRTLVPDGFTAHFQIPTTSYAGFDRAQRRAVKDPRFMDAVAKAQYADTQMWMEKAGVQSLYLTRGVGLNKKLLKNVGSADEWHSVHAAMQPFSSFSSNPGTPLQYAAGMITGTQGNNNVIMRAKIPAAQVFGHQFNGLGHNGRPEEWIVLGGMHVPMEAIKLSHPEADPSVYRGLMKKASIHKRDDLVIEIAKVIGVDVMDHPETELVGTILGVEDVAKIGQGTIRRTGRSKNPHRLVTDSPRTEPLTLKGTVPQQRRQLKSHMKEQIGDIRYERELFLKDLENDVHTAGRNLSETKMDRYYGRLKRLYDREDVLRADRGRLVSLMGRTPKHQAKDEQVQLGRMTDYMLLQSLGHGRTAFPGTFKGEKGKRWLNNTLMDTVEPKLADAYIHSFSSPDKRGAALLTAGTHAREIILPVARRFNRDRPPHTSMTHALTRLASQGKHA